MGLFVIGLYLIVGFSFSYFFVFRNHWSGWGDRVETLFAFLSISLMWWLILSMSVYDFYKRGH